LNVAGKGRAARWVQGKPTLVIVWTAVVGLVIGVLVGVAVGYKVEQHRVHNDVTKLQTKLAGGHAATTHRKGTTRSGPLTLPVERSGTVAAIGNGAITLATKQHGSLVVHLTGGTKFEQTTTGRTGDINVGRRVLLAKGGHDLIVLAQGDALGRKVTKVTNGVATVTKIKGLTQLPLSTLQTVDTTTAATAGSIKNGTHVLAWYHPAGKRTPDAIEVILLPAGSAFG
jgi:hypothetical protein